MSDSSSPDDLDAAPQATRLLLFAAARDAWYEVEGQRRQDVLDALVRVMAAWRDTDGVTAMWSFDDDVAMAGNPAVWGLPSIYIGMDVADPALVGELVHQFRVSEPNLDRYFSIRAVLGRPFWPVEAVIGDGNRLP